MKFNFGGLQRFGKSLMVPVALLPAAGILLGIGAALNGPLANQFEFFQSAAMSGIGKSMGDIGYSIFKNLPMIFAIGVAVGLTNGAGVAALSAFVGYIIMNTTISLLLNITPEMVAESGKYGMALGVPTLETGVLGGILIGLLSVYVYNKFHKVQLPELIGFFGGERFVGIVMVFASILLGFGVIAVWPSIQAGINSVAVIISGDATNPLYIGLFGFFERLLIPTGLHHIWNTPFLWTELGGTAQVAGERITGDQGIFLAQIAAGETVTAGRFMTGKFPVIMFGLLGAALAMYRQADGKNRKIVKGLLVAAAGTAFLTGITEPIEFTFLFVAPLLFVFHAFLTGISFALTYVLDVHLGWAGGSGLIDYILVNALPGTPNWWMNIIIGAGFFFVYFFSFSFAIKKWDIATPGRAGQEAKLFTRKDYNAQKEENKGTGKKKSQQHRDTAEAILHALGGQENLEQVDACVTRLRVSVHDVSLVDEPTLKSLGAAGVFKFGNNIQAVYGSKADLYKNEIKEMIKETEAS